MNSKKRVSKPSRSIKKYVRRAKALIREEAVSPEEQRKKFGELYKNCGFTLKNKE